MRLVYYMKYVLMDIGNRNIIRSICRSLEVLLFFVISVVGFSVLVKTTSLSSKSKTKSQYGCRLAPRELCISESALPLHYALEGIHGFFTSQHKTGSSSFTIHSGTPPFPDILHRQHLPIEQRGSEVHNNGLSISSPLHKPDNLFQQNPVLLI